MTYQTDPEIQKIRDGIMKQYEIRSAPNSDRAYIEAEEDGLVVVLPKDNEIQLDLDSDRDFAIYQEMKSVLDQFYYIISEKVEPSRSGLPKRHVTIELSKRYNDPSPLLNVFERIAIQACLGSDRVREFLGVVQAKNSDPHPTLFLEKMPEVAPLDVPLY